ncbi:3'-5' exonuclease [Desulfolutivibrio sulfoxidireducens]|nr:3'-5' exonuclease [Desulfolutivibrio sulfoxidireducens]QLA21615.1 3'-5' exonuclease [Desulfolutivibrio sulfoxidireducens]
MTGAIGPAGAAGSILTRLFRRLRPARVAPHPLITRHNERLADLDPDARLDACEFTVLDTELTGLDPRHEEIVSIGAVRVRSLRIVSRETFHVLVRPRKDLPKESTLIHRITPDQVRDRPRLRHILPDFLEFVGTSLIVGHHVGLDMAFLNRAMDGIFGGRMGNPCLDTLRMAQIHRAEHWENYYDRYALNVSYALSDLALEWGLPLFPAHEALADAMQTAYLFLYLIKKIRGGRLETLSDLYRAGRNWRWHS